MPYLPGYPRPQPRNDTRVCTHTRVSRGAGTRIATTNALTLWFRAIEQATCHLFPTCTKCSRLPGVFSIRKASDPRYFPRLFQIHCVHSFGIQRWRDHSTRNAPRSLSLGTRKQTQPVLIAKVFELGLVDSMLVKRYLDVDKWNVQRFSLYGGKRMVVSHVCRGIFGFVTECSVGKYLNYIYGKFL